MKRLPWRKGLKTRIVKESLFQSQIKKREKKEEKETIRYHRVP